MLFFLAQGFFKSVGVGFVNLAGKIFADPGPRFVQLEGRVFLGNLLHANQDFHE
jgi:hypothetical protein